MAQWIRIREESPPWWCLSLCDWVLLLPPLTGASGSGWGETVPDKGREIISLFTSSHHMAQSSINTSEVQFVSAVVSFPKSSSDLSHWSMHLSYRLMAYSDGVHLAK